MDIDNFIWIASEEACDVESPLPENNDDRAYRLAVTILALHANKVKLVIGDEAQIDFLNEISMDVCVLASDFENREITEDC